MERLEMPMNGGGTLTLWEEGGPVRFRAVRDNDGRGLYKVWVWGETGRMLLGTLAPEGPCLCLNRRVWKGELERYGCWPVTGGETVLAFAFGGGWQREEYPERLVTDPVLRQVLSGQTMLLRRGPDGFSLAAPFVAGGPFSLVPLFCLGKLERVEGKAYVVFSFDKEGQPAL